MASFSVIVSITLLYCSVITSALKILSIFLYVLQSTILNKHNIFNKITISLIVGLILQKGILLPSAASGLLKLVLLEMFYESPIMIIQILFEVSDRNHRFQLKPNKGKGLAGYCRNDKFKEQNLRSRAPARTSIIGIFGFSLRKHC